MAKPKIRWEFKSKGFREVLFSPGVKADLERRGQAIAAAAGEGFAAETFSGGYGGGRPIVVVRSTTREADLAEAENKALSKAIDAGR